MKSRGFTLIELLIVVAIIAILAAIAVPNFLEAQMRSKVSASKASQRALALAVEAYRVDWNQYPHYPHPNFAASRFMGSHDPETRRLYMGYTPVSLTTPLSYMTSLPRDVFAYAKASQFAGADGQFLENPLQLYQWEHHRTPHCYRPDIAIWDSLMPEGILYMILGVGPDLKTPMSTNPESFHNNCWEYLQTRDNAIGINGFYDPTNGTISIGDIVYFGPGMGFQPTKFR